MIVLRIKIYFICNNQFLYFSGLLQSSSVILVASMLISPLMGPILAGVFGTVVVDNKLR